jgi:hypothetical protein
VKRILVLICGCLLSTNAFAQRPAYEAHPGLIPIGGFILFYDSEGPLSYQTMTPQEVPNDVVLVGEVVGNSCQHGLTIPIISSANNRTSVSGAKGDGSYRQALFNIQQKHPDLAGLYDVKVDIQRLSILTIYSKECTIVVAQGFKENDSNKTTEELSE